MAGRGARPDPRGDGALGNIIRAASSAVDVAHQLQRADALRRVPATSAAGSTLTRSSSVWWITRRSCSRPTGWRVLLLTMEAPNGRVARPLPSLNQRGLDLRGHEPRRLRHERATADVRRPLPRRPAGRRLRAAVVQEGFHTACLRPSSTGKAGAAPASWPSITISRTTGRRTSSTCSALGRRPRSPSATRATTSSATWAAQLQSIQQLGTRLNRWGSVTAIGQAIAAELRQLIDYHNVRVYRLRRRGRRARRVARRDRRIHRRGTRAAATQGRRGHHRLGRPERHPAVPPRCGTRSALPDDPGHRGRPRRVDAHRADALRGPGARRHRALQARPPTSSRGDDLRSLEIYA